MQDIRYIGNKGHKKDEKTGIVWPGPGSVQEVPDNEVNRLLMHTDIWQEADIEWTPPKMGAPATDAVIAVDKIRKSVLATSVHPGALFPLVEPIEGQDQAPFEALLGDLNDTAVSCGFAIVGYINDQGDYVALDEYVPREEIPVFVNDDPYEAAEATTAELVCWDLKDNIFHNKTWLAEFAKTRWSLDLDQGLAVSTLLSQIDAIRAFEMESLANNVTINLEDLQDIAAQVRANARPGGQKKKAA